ncbi:hypothetical protein [Candidatus Methanodesulfokora washburnensis]|nr:hypothetical protein [Candidatus Methanodesulfokores washburnensis]
MLLIFMLEEIRAYLRKEYKLTPSEQSLEITSHSYPGYHYG